MVWLRLVDPECEDIPRRGHNVYSDPDTIELDVEHIRICTQCMNFMNREQIVHIDEPMFRTPDLVCRNCDNPLGEPWHHPKSRRCYFGEGPLWRRAWDRVRRFFWFHL